LERSTVKDPLQGTAAFAALEKVASDASVGRFSWFNFTLGFGLQNNLAVLRYQHLAAKWAERTLVLPRTMPSRGRSVVQQWNYDNRYKGVLVNADAMEWRDIPIEDILDLPYLRACTAHLGMRTLTADEAEMQGVPPPVLIEEGYENLATIITSRNNKEVSTSHNGVYIGLEIIVENPQLHSQIHAFDACLAYNPEFYRVAGVLATSIHKRFGVSVGNMVTLHSRIEDDMLAAQSEVGDLRFNFIRAIGKIEACLNKVAPPSKGLPLFVPTGESFANSKYDWFRQAYGNLSFSTEQFDSALIEDLRLRQGLDAGTGIIDLLVAQESGLFIGCICSSLSTRIAQYRHKLGRPSYLYNGEK